MESKQPAGADSNHLGGTALHFFTTFSVNARPDKRYRTATEGLKWCDRGPGVQGSKGPETTYLKPAIRRGQ